MMKKTITIDELIVPTRSGNGLYSPWLSFLVWERDVFAEIGPPEPEDHFALIDPYGPVAPGNIRWTKNRNEAFE